MEEKLLYEIKISVYESGASRMEKIKKVNPDHVRSILLQQAESINRAMIKAEIMNLVDQRSQLNNLPDMKQILRSKQ